MTWIPKKKKKKKNVSGSAKLSFNLSTAFYLVIRVA